VVAPEGDLVILCVLESVTETVGVGVKGRVVGIPERVIETVPDRVRDRVPDPVIDTVPDMVGRFDG
jgi:hypothetical protein